MRDLRQEEPRELFLTEPRSTEIAADAADGDGWAYAHLLPSPFEYEYEYEYRYAEYEYEEMRESGSVLRSVRRSVLLRAVAR